jgi:hypothetical protein
MEQEKKPIEILLHSLFYGYQKVVRQRFKMKGLATLPPLLEEIINASKKLGIEFKGKTPDEVFKSYSQILMDSGLVKNAGFEKLGPDKYQFHVDGCILAKSVHSALKPKNLTCPLAMIAMAYYEKLSGQWVKINDSEFDEEGTKTVIEPT